MKQNQRTILIIDDSLEDRETYRRYLLQDANYSYRIFEEEYGENGLELCREVEPDAILLDFRLPDIDGLEFLSELKTQTGKNKLPVVMLTGQGNEAIAVAAIKSGAQDYLVKGGMTPENLRLAIHNTLELENLKRQLEESEERLRLLESAVVNANDAVIITETTPLGEPGPRILYVNEAFTRMTGYAKEEVVGLSPRFLQGPKTNRATLDRMRAELRARQPVEAELINYHKDGSELWVEISITPVADATGKYTHFVAIQRDITERKQAEKQLRQSLRFIERIADTTPNILYLYDQSEQRNVYVNRRITEVLGYTRSAIRQMGTTVLQNLVHPDDLARRPEYIKQLSSAPDNSIFEFEYRMKDVNGVWHWFCSRDTVFTRAADGSPHQLLGIVEEITSRKRIEAERAKLLAQERSARAAAEAANRAKDQFLAVVSHELRNPLSAILAYAQLLQSRNLNEHTTVRALQTIERNAKLQAKLINDLLDISRITSGTLHLNMFPVDLALAIEASIETMRLAAQAKAITIESRLEPIFGYVLGDVERLQQVIGNLLSNAIKFTPEGGGIQVKLRCLDAHVQVTVSDTGQGISAEFLPHVFDPFRQAAYTGSQGGLGLGLAIVRHLVELHGGTIEAESPGEGQGSTFTIKLPLVDNDR